MVREPNFIFKGTSKILSNPEPGCVGFIKGIAHIYTPEKFESDEYLFREPVRLYTFCPWVSTLSHKLDPQENDRIYLF